MLQDILTQAHAGKPLWLPELRERFAAAQDAAPLILRLRSFDGCTRDFPLRLPHWQTAEELALIRDYLCANIYNALSACGGYELTVFADPSDAELTALLSELPTLFQLNAARRRGLGKVVSIAGRMGRAFGKGGFSLKTADIADCHPLETQPQPTPAPLAARLRTLCGEAEKLNVVGIDIGGTDIKLAASRQGKLIAVKEYDWNPAAMATADELLGPILLLTRLMRACLAADVPCPALERALRKDATTEEMTAAVRFAEQTWNPNVLDAVGVSFPDIVLRDRIVGGETPKTDGLRRNPALDYETEFARLGGLRDELLKLCRGEGRCRIVNDGHMAAFTGAVELSCGGEEERIERGVIAHSLGTDLGTGWLDERGEIPQLPLELYDLWLDLGSFPAAAFPPEDLRSTRNENSGLPGARRYLGQSAAFRLAWERKPALLQDFTEERDGLLRIVTEPDDLRKPCLEHLMRCAAEGDPDAEEIFRRIGRHLAVVSREFDHLLHPAARSRLLYGRFVKNERCFALLREGFAEGMPDLDLVNGGEGLANTPLMRALEARSDVTVAQFAQAVGAIYYALL